MSEAANSRPDEPTPKRRPPRNNWGWIAFFVFAFVASVGVAGFMIWFNWRIQLTRDKLDAARTRWDASRPQNYDMIYTEQHSGENRPMHFAVKVRDGKVTSVLMNGKPLEKNEEQKEDPRIYHSMDYLFRIADRFMDIDTKKDARKVYVTAVFEKESGALRHYIRRVMGSQERVEIIVKEIKRVER